MAVCGQRRAEHLVRPDWIHELDVTTFLALTYATLSVCILAVVAGYRKYRDSFHPLVYLGALCAFLYGAMPLMIAGGLRDYFSGEQLVFIQTLNLLGTTALLLGARFGSGKRVRASTDPIPRLTSRQRRRIVGAAKAVGLLSVAAFTYGIIHVGGFASAYGHAYGGGWASSGYVRALRSVSLPALLWLMIAYRGRRPPWTVWLWVALFAAPLTIQGLLGARRGPTMMVALGVGAGWYLLHRRRPRLATVAGGGLAIGLLALTLVANRGNIHLGTRQVITRSPFSRMVAGPGNTFTYGGGVIIDRMARGNYGWGRRYLVVFLVRPIPSAIWPHEYKDAAAVLGIPNMRANGGLGTVSFAETVGWMGALGAAAGIVANMWASFWWFSLVALVALGYLFGVLWRRCLARGGPWIPLYAVTMALSPYLVMQGIEAMGFRFLLLNFAVWLAWKFGTGKKLRPRRVLRSELRQPGVRRAKI